MRHGQKLLIFAILLAAAAVVTTSLVPVASFADSGMVYAPYRYRLTVEVETPQGLRTGSSVIEVSTRVAGRNNIPSPGHVYIKVRGEAVAVDLPNGQTLFALLRSQGDPDWAADALFRMADMVTPLAMAKGNDDDRFHERMRRTLALQGKHELPREWPASHPRYKTSGWPMLIYFKETNDRTTVEPVSSDDLTKAFGQGYAVSRVTIERTQAETSLGIVERLPWLSLRPDLQQRTARQNKIGIGNLSESLSTEIDRE